MDTSKKNEIIYDPEIDKKLMDGHEYDGIRELDNVVPSWLLSIFLITVIFSGFYLVYYHVYAQGKLQDQEYTEEVIQAKEMYKSSAANAIDETKIELLSDEASLKAGKDLYMSKTCATCHGNLGEGNAIGPNLCDEYWIHGNTPAEVFKTIKYGFAAKGMLPFKDQINDQSTIQLTSYILTTMKGTTPPNAKAPQGDKK